MNSQKIAEDAKSKFSQSKAHFEDQLSKLRTGRAHPSMLDSIKVEAYGTEMPLLQCGSISVPEPTLLQITPFDPSNIEAISAAIRADQTLDLNPSDDGRLIRIPLPPLTTERRQQIVKTLHEKMEDSFITMRTSRHEYMDLIKEAKNDKDLSEDEAKRISDDVDAAMNEVKSQIESLAKTKEEEIMTI